MTRQDDGKWSFETDIKRYERLLSQVKDCKVWTGDKLGWPSRVEFEQQIVRLQEILTQLREAAKSN